VLFSPKATTRRSQDVGEGGSESGGVYDHGTRDIKTAQ
jgi:hypothetical protein